MNGIEDKRILVTGASSGIGQAIAIRLAAEGGRVGINFFRSREGAQETMDVIQGAGSRHSPILLPADLADESSVDSMFDHFLDEMGGIDILINNAAWQAECPSHETSRSEFEAILATNLTGAFHCAQRTLSNLRQESRPGVIINISSVHEIIPKPGFIGYSASKGGMQNLTRTLALEYAPHGIRVNGVAPGATITPINRAWINDPKARADVESHIPMGRSGTPEEMAGLTAYLCSDDASYITGQTIFIDGGLTLYPEFGTNWSS
ncbi:MAG: sugar dehydrogenase [Roseibacillus sp.]|nr:sugar dehydrogenase [Roseibacillus sp.]|tara:strand:- start:92 stop:883 length:792 start_codon:yes stop_codon:yes gene_type:complete